MEYFEFANVLLKWERGFWARPNGLPYIGQYFNLQPWAKTCGWRSAPAIAAAERMQSRSSRATRCPTPSPTASSWKITRLEIYSEYTSSKTNKSSSQATKYPIPSRTSSKSKYRPTQSSPTRWLAPRWGSCRRICWSWRANSTMQCEPSKWRATDVWTKYRCLWVVIPYNGYEFKLDAREGN